MFKINKCLRLARGFPSAPRVRNMSGDDKCPPRYECKQPGPDEYEKEMEELREMNKPKLFSETHEPNAKLWRNLFLFVCAPTVLCVFVNVYCMGEEKTRRPKFVEYSHLRIRRKEYPWDPVRTLFHNPKFNALPTGYETEVPEEDEYEL